MEVRSRRLKALPRLNLMLRYSRTPQRLLYGYSNGAEPYNPYSRIVRRSKWIPLLRLPRWEPWDGNRGLDGRRKRVHRSAVKVLRGVLALTDPLHMKQYPVP